MNTSTLPRQEHTLPPFPVRLAEHYLGLTLVVWAAATAFTLALVLVVASVRSIEISGWDRISEAVRWFGLAIGIHIGWSVLPRHIAHGQTRREFMAQSAMFILTFAAVLAVLTAITFLAEAGLYRLAGWPQDIEVHKLYGSGLEVHLIFLQFLLVSALWTAGGAFLAASWYRSDALGSVALVVAIAIAGIAGITFSADWGPVGWAYEQLTGDDAVSAPIGVAIHLVLIALVLGLTWLVVRDMPLRARKA